MITTDPEGGCFHKGKKQKCFAYTNLTFWDRQGYVLQNTVAPGHMHDSVIFHNAYKKLKEKYQEQKPTTYNDMILREMLLSHLLEVLQTARNRMELLMD